MQFWSERRLGGWVETGSGKPFIHLTVLDVTLRAGFGSGFSLSATEPFVVALAHIIRDAVE